jgi:hypothetical protein
MDQAAERSRVWRFILATASQLRMQAGVQF